MHHAPLASIQLHYVPSKKICCFMIEILLLLRLWLRLLFFRGYFCSITKSNHLIYLFIHFIHIGSRFSLFLSTTKPLHHAFMFIIICICVDHEQWIVHRMKNETAHQKMRSVRSLVRSLLFCVCVRAWVYLDVLTSFRNSSLFFCCDHFDSFFLRHQRFQRILVETPETRPRWFVLVRVCLCLWSRAHSSVNKTKFVLLLGLVRWKKYWRSTVWADRWSTNRMWAIFVLWSNTQRKIWWF